MNGRAGADPPGRRHAPFTFLLDGVPVPVRRGQTIATALLAAGHDAGVFCAIGVCQGCLVDIEGRGRVVGCQTPAEPGMAVSRPVSW